MTNDSRRSASIDYRAVIESESARMADILDAGPLDAPVTGCPGWSLIDLGVHLGHVQRWATTVIATGRPDGADNSPGSEDLGPWFRDGTRGLLAAIDASHPEADCWNLWPTGEQKIRFWYRRQALEVAVHRWDAEAAIAAQPGAIDPVVAADVVDEWVHVILPRNLERSNIDVASLDGDVHLHATDTPGEWVFEIIDGEFVASTEHRKSVVAARGPAHGLALLCYGRSSHGGVEVFGDAAVLDRWLGKAD